MQFFKDNINFDFMGARKTFLVVSAIAVAVCVVLTIAIGPKFGIDFMGGTEIQVRFKENADASQIRAVLRDIGFSSAEVVSVGSEGKSYLIRLHTVSAVSAEQSEKAKKSFQESLKGSEISKFDFSPGGDKLTIRISKEQSIESVEKAAVEANLSLGAALEQPNSKQENAEAGAVETSKKCKSVTCTWPYQNFFVYEISLKGVSDRIMDGLRAQSFGQNAERERSEWVGPKVGQQLKEAGIWSVVYALILIMIYIAVRFDLRFAPGAVVALIHDVFITVGIFTIARVEFTLGTIAALLTIIGYSLNDTIVVFDRIRENMSKMKERRLVSVINMSINQTLSRTILTSLTTLFVVVALLTIGWNTNVRDFAFALLIGIIVGTYSSIFIASPIVAWIDSRFFKKTE